ncbi:type I-C CRISPR-associated protein Cas8c/Csd1 [Actinoalloteichus caeruleus]|uniref:type I-C CRISPR-associated protein Cas8c/Csd1 n=1 Tax=Actinoalloteichus cyanogriseus TaxID=2893586 RepID=UPI0004AB8398|nr:type I-C CRISPR-associated protein Cas8c/Csd1 [Actinoalloteichus caeruleus]
MLVKRLVDHAQRQGTSKPFHRERELHWQLEISTAGRPPLLTRVTDPAATRPGRGVSRQVPAVVRTVGISPNLAADDIQYVLGWADEKTKPERAASCHAAFVDLVTRWAADPAAQDDTLARAVAAFYQQNGPHRVAEPEGWTSKQGVLLVVDGVPATEAPSVVPFWSTEVARRKAGGAATGLCLSCGTVAPLVDTVPGKVPKKLVPGASNDAALVSVNERVFGYQLTTGLTHTPLCMVCADSMTTGLVAVLSSDHTSSYARQDSKLAWWYSGPPETDWMAQLEQPDPSAVSRLLTSPHEGKAVANGGKDLTRFHALTVSGNIARIMVRDWVEMPLPELERNIRSWFEDIEIVRARGHDRPLRLWTLVLATGRWQPKLKAYAEMGSKSSRRPERLHRQLVATALRNTPPPPELRHQLLARITNDGRVDAYRAALLRLSLVRQYGKDHVMPGLDETNTDPAYLCGRIFTLLQRIQRTALGDVNTSFADRHFAGALSKPDQAVTTGMREAQPWLKKLWRDKTKRGLSVRLDRELARMTTLLEAAALPARFTTAQQSCFVLGYYHQKARYDEEMLAALEKKNKEAEGGPDAEPDTP